jgi:6-phosphogluconolactonase
VRALVASYDLDDRATDGLLSVVETDAGGLRLRAQLELRRASYLAARAPEEVYVAQELPESRLALVRVAGDRLEVLDETETPGASACHVAVHPGGRMLGVAHYSSGTVAFHAVDAEGRFTGTPQVLAFAGSGPVADRQDAAHPHQVVFSDDGTEALVPDLGADRIHVLRIDDDRVEHVDDLVLPAGTGPRHLVRTRRFLTVVGELDARVHWTLRGEAPEWRSTPIGPAASALRARPGTDDVIAVSRGDGRLRELRLGERDAEVRLEAAVGAARDAVVTADGFLAGDQTGDVLRALDASGAETGRLALPTPACILPLG